MIRSLIALMISTSIGCVMIDVEDEHVGSARLTVDTTNSLSMNSLSMNSLSMNSLSMNSLSMNSLDTESIVGEMDLNRDGTAGLEATSEGRLLLAYSARCALRDGDFLIEEIDGTTHVFPGLLGVAPKWAHRGLNRAERHRVSACLLAHVNAFGISVPLSLRGARIDILEAEKETYFVHEAAFFGDVFRDSPRMYACWVTPHDVAVSLTDMRSVRVCADRIEPGKPDSMCTSDPANPIIVTGPCSSTCTHYKPGVGWNHCWSNTGRFYRDAINAWLSDDS